MLYFRSGVYNCLFSLSVLLFLMETNSVDVRNNERDNHYLSENRTKKNGCPNIKNIDGLLSRKRRGLAFPDGSTFVVELSTTKIMLFRIPSSWNTVMEADLVYSLPDKALRNRILNKKLHHRQRRDFWRGLEDALSFKNLNGQACIIKAICETKMILASPGKSLVHDILRTIFSVPLKEQLIQEDTGFNDDGIWSAEDDANDPYHQVQEDGFCAQYLGSGECPMSIIDFVLGLNRI